MNKLKWRIFFDSDFFALSMIGIVGAVGSAIYIFFDQTIPAHLALNSLQGSTRMLEQIEYKLAQTVFPYSIVFIALMLLLVVFLLWINIKRFRNIKSYNGNHITA